MYKEKPTLTKEKLVEKFKQQLDRVVNQEIYCNQSYFISHIFVNNLEEFEFTIENIHLSEISDYSEDIMSILRKEHGIRNRKLTQELINDYRWDVEQYLKENAGWFEPLEYWVCSGWLEGQLKEKGELMVEHTPTGETWWGRGCSGQSIKLDSVIREIAFEMAISFENIDQKTLKEAKKECFGY